MGPATDPYSFGHGKDLVPGVGVKFLRTGVSSANFMLLHSLDPLANNNFNFFAEPVSNHLSGFKYIHANDMILTYLYLDFYASLLRNF